MHRCCHTLRELIVSWENGATERDSCREQSRGGKETQSCVPNPPCFIFLLSTQLTCIYFPATFAVMFGHTVSSNQWNRNGRDVFPLQAWSIKTCLLRSSFSVYICQLDGEHSGDLDESRATRRGWIPEWIQVVSSSSHSQILLVEDMKYIGLIHWYLEITAAYIPRRMFLKIIYYHKERIS